MPTLSKAELAAVRALREKKHRETTGRFVVEGPKVVAELIAAGYPLEAIYATPDWCPPPSGSVNSSLATHHSPLPEHSSLIRVTPDEMARLSHYPTPSAVLAIGRLTRATLAPGELAQGLTLALDGVQDAGNVGTMIRLADWFGLARVLLSPDCADLFSQKVINATMGSFSRVRVITTPLAEALAGAPAGLPILGCDLAGTPLASAPRPAAAVIVIGSEGRGLSADVAARLTGRITIPRHGAAESLNAAVAAGIVLAHLRGAA